MTQAFGGLVSELPAHGLLCAGDQLVIAHCHHYTLFLEQTIFDALGGEGGAVRRQAAFEAAHALLAPQLAPPGAAGPDARSRLLAGRKADSPGEKLDLASELFAAMGHGRLRFELGAEGGLVRGETLHHATSFLQKYGGRLRNRAAVDAFAAGYCSAAASLAFPSDWGRLEAEEVSCTARGDAACTFVLTRRPERPRLGTIVTRALVEAATIHAPPHDGAIARARSAGAAMLASLAADGRGVVSAYGVQLALLPASYVDQITFDAMHLVERRSPELFPALEALLREAAQAGAFHLLGGMLASPAFAAAHGPIGRDQPERLEQLLGLARALGWGAFHAAELSPGRLLVLRSPVTHESAYHAIRHGATVRSRLAFQQGTAVAIMQLLHRVDFGEPRPIEPDTYAALFKTGTRFHVEETASPLRGDETCEVRVEAMADTW